MLAFLGQQLRKRFQAHLDALGVATPKQLEIPIMKVSHDKRSYGCRGAETGGNVVSRDDVRLQISGEGEDGDPSGEDVGEGVHLVRGGMRQFTAIRRLNTTWKRRGGQTKAEVYARFSGSSRVVSFTHVQVMPAHVPDSAVR